MSIPKIGPNPCAYCGGMYGEHRAWCKRPPRPPTLEERVSALESELFDLREEVKLLRNLELALYPLPPGPGQHRRTRREAMKQIREARGALAVFRRTQELKLKTRNA